MAGTWRDYLSLLESLGETLEKLAEIERAKTKAVSSGDLNAVEQCMKQEQVISLSLRGMDQKRDKLLGELGIAGTALRGLAERVPPDMAMEAKAVEERLRQRYEVFQAASDVARNTLECNLHAIEKIQKAQEEQGEMPLPQSDFRA